MGIFKLSTVFGVVLVWWCTVTWTLDMEGSIESNCFPVKPIDVDLEWIYKQHFYLPLVSRSKLYRLIVQMLEPEEPSEIIEGSIYYDSCVRWKYLRNSSVIVSGYGGTRETNYITETLPDVKGVSFRPSEGDGGHRGTAWKTKTDNMTYVVVADCSNDNMEGVVLSTMPILPPLTVKQIKEHVIEMGFKEAYFTGLRYDLCPKEQAHL